MMTWLIIFSCNSVVIKLDFLVATLTLLYKKWATYWIFNFFCYCKIIFCLDVLLIIKQILK